MKVLKQDAQRLHKQLNKFWLKVCVTDDCRLFQY